MRNRKLIAARLAAAGLAASLFFCGAAQAGTVTIKDGWIRAMPADVPAGGYFTLVNDSGKRVVLTGASSPGCGMLMLHQTEMSGGMAGMSDIESIPVAVGGTLKFAPGGYHLMCMDPTAAIKPGNKVPVTLIFADGAKLTTEFVVRSATGR